MSSSTSLIQRFGLGACCLLAASSLFAKQSLRLVEGTTVSIPLPNGTPYTLAVQKNQSFRFEFRVHDWSPVAAAYGDRLLWTTSANAFWCGIDEKSVLACADWFDTVDDAAKVSVSGRTDFVAALQRDVVGGRFSLQVCDVDLRNCVNSSAQIIKNPGAGNAALAGGRLSLVTFGAQKTSASLAFFRWRSGTPATPPREADSPADLLDLEFEGNTLVAGATAALRATASGVRFAASPVHLPGCSAGVQKSFRAGFPATLDGTGSNSADDSASLTYEWTQQSGPTTVVWSNPSSAQPVVTGLQFGSYVFNLKVTDASGQSSTCNIKHGAVATDNNGVVIYQNAIVSQILGPVIRWGANPWPWFDQRNKVWADHFSKLLSVAPPAGYLDFWNTAAQGTIKVSQNSAAVQGTGTTFRTSFCGGGSKPAPGSNIMLVWYPLPGGGTGRRTYNVSACESDTALTLSRPYVQQSGSGVSYTVAEDDGLGTNRMANWINGSNNANYYDNVMAYYLLYYRSGIDDYRNYARTLADRWWSIFDEGRICSDDNGNWCSPPRVRSVTGLVLRALDGRADMWPGLRLWMDYDASNMQRGINNTIYDIREEAAIVNELALGAIADPAVASRTKYQTVVANLVTQKWSLQQQPNKNWLAPTYGYSSWNGFPGTVNVVKGSTTVTNVGGTWDCGRSDLWPASSKLWTTVGANDSTHGDSINYAVRCMNSTTLSITPAYQGNSASGRGWAIGPVSGSGTQPFMMGFVGSAMSRVYEALKSSRADAAALAKQFTVDSVNWIRNSSYGGYRSQWKGLWYLRGFIGCEPDPSQNPDCMAGDPSDNTVVSSRYLAAETMHAFAQAYTYSHDPGILAAGDELYTALYGPAPSLSITGDGTDLCSFLCDDSWDLSHDKAKTFGFAFGWGNGAAWPAVRALVAANKSTARAVPVRFDLESAPQATYVRLTVTSPSGNIEEYTCTSSPCTATVDPDQGQSILRIDYMRGYGGPVAGSVTSLIEAQ